MTHDLWQIVVYCLATVVGIFALSFLGFIALFVWAFRKAKQEETELDKKHEAAANRIQRSGMPNVESYSINPATGRKLS